MWTNRVGGTADDKFKDIEEEFGLENLKNQVLETFPDADSLKEGDLVLVDDSGTLYLVTKRDGIRYRAAFTAF